MGCIEVLNSLAAQYLTYSDTGQAEVGLECLTRADALCRTSQGSAKRYAAQLSNIATTRGALLSYLDRHAEALACYRGSLVNDEKQYGKQSEMSAMCWANIGSTLGSMGDTAGCLEACRKAAAIYERCGMGNSMNSALVQVNIGKYEATLENYSEALVLMKRSLAILKKLLPADHPHIAKLQKNLASVNLHLGNGDAYVKAIDDFSFAQRRSQTACAGPGCTRKLKADGKPLDVCVMCRRTFYCGKDCQTADWKAVHKKECKALIAAAAAAASEESR